MPTFQTGLLGQANGWNIRVWNSTNAFVSDELGRIEFGDFILVLGADPRPHRTLIFVLTKIGAGWIDDHFISAIVP